jgi:hypothetical protein
MLLVITTFDKSLTIDRCLKRYRDLKYKPEVFMGLNAIENNISKNHICYINLKNLLKKYIDYNEDLLISEDDAYLLKWVRIEKKNRREINWLGYWARKANNDIYGCTLYYIPKEKVKELYLKMERRKPIHLDYFFNKYLDKIISNESFTKEIEHYSIIYQGVREHKNVVRIREEA